MRTRTRTLALAALLATSAFWRAAPAQVERSAPSAATNEEVADQGATDGADRPTKDGPESTFRGSELSWDNSATVQTLGLGQDYQSRNPTYEMSLGLAPRLYLYDRETRSLSARGNVQLVAELTNSDSTSRERELTLTDTELWLELAETLHNVKGEKTVLSLRAPTLVLPTSKVSASNGKIAAVGLGLGASQQLPLRGAQADVLPEATLRAQVAYAYQLAHAVVPTSEEIDRVRLFPDGRSLPSDQLSGGAFPQHLGSVGGGVELGLTTDLVLGVDLGLQWTYKYDLPQDVQVCDVVVTGCADVPSNDDATRYGVTTLFGVRAGYPLLDELSLSVGYVNLASQLGADGQRRNVFYSPDARGYVTLSLALDKLYGALDGRAAAANIGKAWPARL